MGADAGGTGSFFCHLYAKSHANLKKEYEKRRYMKLYCLFYAFYQGFDTPNFAKHAKRSILVRTAASNQNLIFT